MKEYRIKFFSNENHKWEDADKETSNDEGYAKLKLQVLKNHFPDFEMKIVWRNVDEWNDL